VKTFLVVFGISFIFKVDNTSAGPVVGDEVTLTIRVEANKPLKKG
jgi:hypothetical protein